MDYRKMVGWLEQAALAPARAYMAQSPQAPQGLLGDMHRAIDPVNMFGGYGGLLAMALPPGARGKGVDISPTVKISEAGPYSGMPKGLWGGRKELRVDGETKAFAEIYMSPNTGLRIQHIETIPGSRRQGYASKLIESLKHEFPGVPISTSMQTKDGMALFRKFGLNDR